MMIHVYISVITVSDAGSTPDRTECTAVRLQHWARHLYPHGRPKQLLRD